jgi:hypothetical protein
VDEQFIYERSVTACKAIGDGDKKGLVGEIDAEEKPRTRT